MSALQTRLTDLREELAENPRLRLGLWLILLISLFYLLLVQAERNDTALGEYAGALQRLEKARELSSAEGWTAALEQVRQRQESLRAALWDAETQGFAQASLQGALSDLMTGLEIRSGRIRSGVSQPLPDLPGVWQIQAQIDGTYRPGAELKLLYGIARHPRKLVIDRLDLSRQNSRLVVLVSAYFTGIAAEE